MTQRQTSNSNQMDSENNRSIVNDCDYVQLTKSDSGLDKLIVDNPFAHCEIYLQGAHVTQFIPTGSDDLLWVSEDANFKVGKAIRGGIPLCWPWFGPSPYGQGSPAHGFVRAQAWKLKSISVTDKQYTQICMEIGANSQTRLLWPFEFSLECKVTIGHSLKVELTTRNLDSKPMNISEAIHSYFAVSDIEQVKVTNLENNSYIDKLADNALIKQEGEVKIEQATDRIYTHSSDEQVIVDNGFKQSILVTKSGANDTVVWNPWLDIAKGMADFSDFGFRNMLCVEAVNSQINPVVIEQGQSHTIVQTIALKP